MVGDRAVERERDPARMPAGELDREPSQLGGERDVRAEELEMELAPLLVVFRYDDVPGVIGRVGTLFAESGVNIANMTVSRTRRGGKALMALSLDGEPPQELVEAVREQGFDDARVIRLGSGAG